MYNVTNLIQLTIFLLSSSIYHILRSAGMSRLHIIHDMMMMKFAGKNGRMICFCKNFDFTNEGLTSKFEVIDELIQNGRHIVVF